ncbi:LacI family transcriptional regulator [Halioglobus maricola]|uniref:LacI family transcriptional regulator n=1 Tax=Halioglobus maricola TaxID=2601894 RepID=A0A5P9NNG5_9GAMM|nr:LacI family DNA-binding transcriptional regulator [Halioglobus maricola]QFU77337.1 LacI family transcriptional regulator [Halioglobus maricola]
MAKVGIKDVAARAGVSTATVSHALRNPDRVAEATRKKVLEAVEAVGYTPNKLGQSLRTSRSGNIVVIIPDLSDTYNAGIITALEKVAHRHGYSVLLGDSQGSERRERDLAGLTDSHQADGIILLSHRLPFDISEGGRKIEDLPPLVNGSEPVGVDGIPFVGIDDSQAGRDATQHLIDYGHRRIAVITGDMNSPSSRLRLQGYRDAMADAGLEVDERCIVHSEYSLAGGEGSAESLLMLRDRPTAIFCGSDEIAIGCMYKMREMGFTVPDDISVIGVDDIRFGKYFEPPLTTVAQPASELGETCAKLLMHLLKDKELPQNEYVLPHKLVVRGSTRRL